MNLEGFSLKDFEVELSRLESEEESIDNELREYFSMLSTLKTQSTSSLSSNELESKINQLTEFTPCHEAMALDSQRLAFQIDDCEALSDHLSVLVRKLDVKQLRAQEALHSTENVLNLMDCKLEMISSLQSEDLPQCVLSLQHFHKVDAEIAKTSEEYSSILQIEKEIKLMAQKKFGEAIDSDNIETVFSLCPFLSSLGLSVQVRDSLLDFMDRSIFIAISASAVGDLSTNDPTVFALIVSNLFNSTVKVLQTHLPRVIQGLSDCRGDLLFIKRLHNKCENEVILVLKRYIQTRNLDSIFATTSYPSSSSSSYPSSSSSYPSSSSSSELHCILDELGLFIQYCCMYRKYLKQLVDGAESIPRPSSSSSLSISVFTAPLEIDVLVDQIINKYYLEGEKRLMRMALQAAEPSPLLSSSTQLKSLKLDECFFLLQRCCLRALACNHINAACSVLQFISDTLLPDLLAKCRLRVDSSLEKVISNLRQSLGSILPAEFLPSTTISQGIRSAMTMASSLSLATNNPNRSSSKASSRPDNLQEEDEEEETADPWGVAEALRIFSFLETIQRYIDRTTRDVFLAAQTVFQSDSPSPEMAKIMICKENFDSVRLSFQQAVSTGLSRLSDSLIQIIGDFLPSVLVQGPPSTPKIRYHLSSQQFSSQPHIQLLPQALIQPIELILSLISHPDFSDSHRDSVLDRVAEGFSGLVERFIWEQSALSFAAALKIEECVRGTHSALSKSSSISLRTRFSRLREVLSSLTSDATELSSDSLSLLSLQEKLMIQNLKIT